MRLLQDALNKRKDEGSPVQFWLRDDDAVEPTKALDTLLELTQRYGVPVTLAVIPAFAGDSLAKRLLLADHATVAVHGWAHKNYAPPGEKKQELGVHRPVDVVFDELKRGYTDLKLRYDTQFVPLLVPPWNRIDQAITERLPSLGFQGLSTFSNQTSSAIPVLNTHVDVMDWKGSRGGKPSADLIDELLVLIKSSRAPIGILTHHLVHDDVVWQFLHELFSTTAKHEGASWMPIDKLLPELTPNP